MLTEESKSFNEQKNLVQEEIQKGKEKLERYKEALHQKEQEILLKEDDHKKVMLKEQSDLELRKVSIRKLDFRIPLKYLSFVTFVHGYLSRLHL